MMEKLAPYRVFTSSSLKLIAVITMLIDHFGATVMSQAILNSPLSKRMRTFTITCSYSTG